MDSSKTHEVIIGGKSFRFPNAIAVIALTALTGMCFLFIDDPQWASLATAGLALLGLMAKGLEINHEEIVELFDVEESEGPVPAQSPALKANDETIEVASDAEITSKGKLGRFLTG